MFRNVVRAFVVAGLVGLGWVAGHAQAPTQSTGSAKPAPPELSASSDFELLISDTRADERGSVEVRCLRGCKLTWAATVIPKDGTPAEFLAPDFMVHGELPKGGCLAPYWMPQNCHVIGFKR
jgi:hypothetical protein